jgi:hypothetical protein
MPNSPRNLAEPTHPYHLLTYSSPNSFTSFVARLKTNGSVGILPKSNFERWAVFIPSKATLPRAGHFLYFNPQFHTLNTFCCTSEI